MRLLLLLLLCQAGFSQENYNYQWFSADSKHLPQNSVKSITPDKYGFIWLSTENGIVRYDGQNFKTYNSETLKGLSSNRMLLFTGSIKKDSIIILNERGETILINKRAAKIHDSLTHRKKLHTLLSKDIYYYKTNRYAPSRKKLLAISVKDKTYLFTQDSINVYNSEYKLSTQKEYRGNDSLQFFVSSGNLYMLNKKNEYSLFSEIHQSYQKFGTDFTKKIKLYTNDIAQQTFLYSDDKLFFLKEINGKITTQLVFSNFNFEANNIVSAYYDEKNEVLFLGSTNKGLLVVKQNDFKHNATPYQHSTGSDDVYYALGRLNDDNIVSATGEIFSTDGKTKVLNIGAHTDKYMIVVDNNGDIWTKDNGLLYRFSKKNDFKTPEYWNLRKVITCLLKGKNGRIFIGTLDKDPKKGNLYSINPSDKAPQPEFISVLDFPPSELFDINGKSLWCGSWKGLYKFHLDTKKTKKIKGIENAHVRNIYSPHQEEVWIGTYNNGFYLYRNGKLTHMPKDRSGYLLTTHCIIEDKYGFMWITTNKGLFVAKKQDLFDYADNKIKKIYYHTYDKSSGFLNNEFNGGCNPCGVNLDNKTIFFPSMDGVVYFNPGKVSKRQPKSDIFLDETEVDTTSFTNSDSLIFNRNFEKIKFHISSPFYGTPYNQNIETRLEGPVVQNWTPMTETSVSFSTLPPGEYKLKIRKLSGFGSQYIYKEYHFSITPAFWQTTWFTILLIALGLLMVYVSFKLRVRYIKHKNIQLEKQVVLRTQQLQTTVVALRKVKEDLSIQVNNHKGLIKTITHDIKSPLKFIAITGRYLYNNMEKSKPISKEDVKAIHTSSSQLYHFVDNFLEYAKETDLTGNESEPYALYILAGEKADFFKNIAAAAKTVISNNVDNKLFLTVNRHLLSIILHNLLDNALKNTFDGTISILSAKEAGTLSISVVDTGKGMSPELVEHYMNMADKKASRPKQKGMGLHMIAELLAITEGTLHIASQENKGTTVTISFKLND